MRRILSLLLLAAVTPLLLLRTPPRAFNSDQTLTITPLPETPLADRLRLLGPFDLTGAWELNSPHTLFGGYSAMVQRAPGRLTAFSDRGRYLDFSLPGTARSRAHNDEVLTGPAAKKSLRDIEAATRDPETGTIWLAWEGRNAISRQGPELALLGEVNPPAMRRWVANTGPESLLRLRDGRFVVLSESYPHWLDMAHHAGLVFSGDPVAGVPAGSFTFAGAKGYRPTDMAQLPDGRVLVLVRKVLWPLPVRFSSRILLADPSELEVGKVWPAKEVARLDYPLPVDNFEGMAISPQPGGLVVVWLVSDDNGSAFQRTLLWRLMLDPRKLPAKSVPRR